MYTVDMFVWEVHVHMCACQKLVLGLKKFPTYFLRQGLTPVGANRLGQAPWPANRRNVFVPGPCTGVTGTCHSAEMITWVLGSELGTPEVQGTHFTD